MGPYIKIQTVLKLANSPNISFKISLTLRTARADFAVYRTQFFALIEKTVKITYYKHIHNMYKHSKYWIRHNSFFAKIMIVSYKQINCCQWLNYHWPSRSTSLKHVVIDKCSTEYRVIFAPHNFLPITLADSFTPAWICPDTVVF